ncbi:MAG: bifunctional alpha,alpha-trehalose-phosphate synthase (UDP-forming)/trehalose-phosphatase [Vulcanimicrobiota bacterium]
MRLVIISNRLSISVAEEGEGVYSYKESAGGLATGLKAFVQSIGGSSKTFTECIWIGWPGISVPKREQAFVEKELISRFRTYPVFLSATDVDRFYLGFCNKTLWPLFHYFPSFTIYDEAMWEHYKTVNRCYLEAVLKIIRPDDVIWIHDYHMMLLPAMLREKNADATIGFFLHIPFPTFEVFRMLPMKWRSELLQGLLGADLIGFHTYSYTQYYLQCLRNILGYEQDMGKVFVGERVVKADAFPISIDYHRFHRAHELPEVKDTIEKYQGILSGRRAILSMDRLDYTKGIINRLKSYEQFLCNYTEWRGKVVLILIVVPSRAKVEHYQLMKRQIDELSGKINGTYGTMDWMPVLYLFQSFSFEEIAALYCVSDIALITPLRDGMNLIAKEYVASRSDGTGVLILSEMAGAAKEMGEAILINPNNTEDIKAALKQALEMPEVEQKKRIEAMQSRIMRYNIIHWAEEFSSSLRVMKEEQKRSVSRIISAVIQDSILKDFRKSRRRMLFLDYDGTLISFSDNPLMAYPTEEIITLLSELASLPETEVTIISGRDRQILSRWFGRLPLNLISEHGVWMKKRGRDWETIRHLNAEWKPSLLPLLERYTDRLPGSFLEDKEYSLVFHYRRSDPEMSVIRIRELVADLVHYVTNKDLQIVHGSKIVEIKNSGINKGDAAIHFLKYDEFDFVLAAGDDLTDEDMFRILPDTVYTVKVGMENTQARYMVNDYKGVLKLLNEIVMSQSLPEALSI